MESKEQIVYDFHCPRWNELPTLLLYMDQVVVIIDEALQAFPMQGEKTITPAMINNYVKAGLITPPVKKKYDRGHVAALIVISLLKRVLSMNEVAGVLRVLRGECEQEEGYNLFCEKAEKAIDAKNHPFLEEKGGLKPAENLLNAVMLALHGKVQVQYLLEEKEPGKKVAEKKPAKEKQPKA